jgi:hypothetical protein
MKISIRNIDDPSGRVSITGGEEDYYDDCPICRAQRRADEAGRLMTGAEFEAAFADAAEMDGVVSDIRPSRVGHA